MHFGDWPGDRRNHIGETLQSNQSQKDASGKARQASTTIHSGTTSNCHLDLNHWGYGEHNLLLKSGIFRRKLLRNEVTQLKYRGVLSKWDFFIKMRIAESPPSLDLERSFYNKSILFLDKNHFFFYYLKLLIPLIPLIQGFEDLFCSSILFLSSFTHFPYLLPVATKWELQQSMHCPLRQCCHSFLFSPSERTKWRSKKTPSNPWIRGIKGIKSFR